MDRHKYIRVRCAGCGRWFKTRSDIARQARPLYHNRQCWYRTLRSLFAAKRA